jgi:endonuclease III
MPRKPKPVHYASDFELDVTSGDTDLFRWFLLSYLFGKPIQSTIAINTWQLFIDYKLDTPWAIRDMSEWELASLLHQGGYTHYEHVTTLALKRCMQQLIDFYDGSLFLMLESSQTEDEFSKQLQKLYGVGPKTAEIIMSETEEVFARRVE